MTGLFAASASPNNSVNGTTKNTQKKEQTKPATKSTTKPSIKPTAKQQKNMQKSLDIEAFLRGKAAKGREAVLAEYESTLQGLTTEHAEAVLEEKGPNVLQARRGHTVWSRLAEAVINPFNIILLLIAAITFVTDVVTASRPDYLTVSIILAMVFLSAAVAFGQSRSSDAAAEELTKMISNKVDVYRDGLLTVHPLEEVVPGDVVRLSAGDMLPADVYFLTTKDTFVSQSALTGESQPVEKFAEVGFAEVGASGAGASGAGASGAGANDAVAANEMAEGAANLSANSTANQSTNQPVNPTVVLSDLKNIGLMGTDLVSGSATALVLATGEETYFSSIADSLTGGRAETAFERGVNSVSKLLVRMMLVILPVILLINGVLKQDWLHALLFAISIAVGLTPEMLPVIMTSTLAKGAVAMSKQNVIVRTLGAIQTFGEMDILCTDKTGTLTEDKIVLEKYMDLTGKDDRRVLRHAYLNAVFQTGLKNLIDLAIINRVTTYGQEASKDKYTRLDEIPFDFNRRRMSVLLEDPTGKRQLITKGAVEEMLAVCTWLEIDGEVKPLGDEERRIAMATYEKYNNDGLRMLAVAQKNEVPAAGAFSAQDEKDMVLIGFVGFLDPPKQSAAQAVTALTEHGVRTVVLTGDSGGVAAKVCRKVGIEVTHSLSGTDVEAMSDEELALAAQTCNLFSKLSPTQKQRVVETFQKLGHTVGFMGDGINDTPALRQADVGISVDSAVDIAKETADIILLKKDLMVLEEGVLTGRRTFGNIMKYIKMAASGNFGNMISVIIASIFLPFLPMLPVHILTQNLLNDFAQLGMAFDNVDPEFVRTPRKWDTKSLQSFMAVMGPLSSIFDVLCFLVLWFGLGANRMELAPLFQAGWFVFGTTSQVVIIHMIRTAKVPFAQSRPSPWLSLSTGLVFIATLLIGFTPIARAIDLSPLPPIYLAWLALLLLGYSLAVQFIKRLYLHHFGEWI